MERRREKKINLQIQQCAGTNLDRKGRAKNKMSSLSEPITSLPYTKNSSPIKCLYCFLVLAFALSFLLIILSSIMPALHFPPSLFFFSISCCCFCTVSLFFKVQIEIPELIPEKQLCFPCHRVAQLVVWLCATITYAARFYVAKEHLVQCHFLSKPNSITMHTGLRSHQPHKISL